MIEKAFYLFEADSQESKETMPKICEDNLRVIVEGGWVLFWYMLFPDQKYLPRLTGFHPLIREQPFYC